MTISPVIERELRLALRKKNSRKSRLKYAAIGVAMGALCLIGHAIFGASSFPIGLHGWLFYLGLYVVVFQTLQLTADLFTQERQNGTFGFLFLAGLSIGELFGGKVLSAFLVSFMNLLALAPCLAIPFLTGGVSFSLFWATLCCLPTILVFTLAVVCLASALWEEESTARVAAVVILLTVSLAPLGLYEISTWSAYSISPLWRLLSPAWGPWLIHRHLPAGTSSEFWLNASVTLAWACVFFTLTGVALLQSWKRELSGTVAPTWISRLREWIKGNSNWRRKQAHWLDNNPYIWLILSNRQPVRLAWTVVSMIVTGSALCCWLMPRPWFRVWILFAVAAAMNGAVQWIVAYTAAKRLGDERRSNALELLLTTPLEVQELIHGQMITLDLQFRPIFLTTSILNFGMMLGGFFMRGWTWKSLCVYMMVWSYLLLWSSHRIWSRTFRNSIKPIWAGFNTGLPALAVARSWGVKLSWYNFIIWWVWSGILMKNIGFPSGSTTEFCLVTAFALPIGGTIIYRARFPSEGPERKIEDMLLSEFRLVAAEPMPDPTDPRLKKWNIGERLYRHRKQLLNP